MVYLMLAGLISLLGCSSVTEAYSDNETFIMGCETDDSQFSPTNRAHDTNAVFDWPQGKIPYRFEGTVTSNDRQVIRRAMNQIEAQTCLRFNEDQTPPNHYLKILVKSPSCCGSCCGSGCSSFSGVVSTQAGSPVVTLTSFRQLADYFHCRSHSEGGILHELMHVLGVQHTQKRNDRDSYIRINTENIWQNRINQYSPPCYGCKNHGVPYDCSSIMHYGTETFSNGRGPTMTPKVSGCFISKQGRSVATSNDWNMLREVARDQCDESGDSCPYTDKYPNSCPGWKNPYCTSGQYIAWMATNCAKTCKCVGICPYTDKYPNNCPGWKNPYCTSGSYIAWMATNCAKTCKC